MPPSMCPWSRSARSWVISNQRPAGYSMQSFFIGVGAVVASMLPWLLDRAGVSNHTAATPESPGIPDTVRYAFEIGAGVLLLAIAWTTLRSSEYPPQTLLSFDDAVPAGAADALDPRRERRKALA